MSCSAQGADTNHRHEAFCKPTAMNFKLILNNVSADPREIIKTISACLYLLILKYGSMFILSCVESCALVSIMFVSVCMICFNVSLLCVKADFCVCTPKLNSHSIKTRVHVLIPPNTLTLFVINIRLLGVCCDVCHYEVGFVSLRACRSQGGSSMDEACPR